MDLTSLEYLGLDHVLKRGTGKILEQEPNALLLRDRVSNVIFLACEDVKQGISLLDRHTEKLDVLMVSNPEIGRIAHTRYGFGDNMECYQVAYYGKMPELDNRLTLRVADLSDFPILAENYHQVSPEELKEIVKRGSVLLGYANGKLVGFIGEHLEGSMGLLYIFPEYRRMGYAYSLESAKISDLLTRGILPFAQIDKNNLPSLALQEKLGMTRSERTIMWLWKLDD